MMRLVLASASPRRQQLLQQMGLSFEVVPSEKEENINLALPPWDAAMELALQKALDVAHGLYKPAWVIGADTIVVKEGILGKPRSKEEAYEMLEMLQGQTHQVITGMALVESKTKKHFQAYETTTVEMAPLSRDEILWYVETGEPMDKAGAYGIQGLAGIFIPRIHGCYYNVMGLPINCLWRMLKEAGIYLH